MSSTLVEVEQTSKKRKHEGDSKAAKKKRKQVDEGAETDGGENGAEELVAKSSKKEKKRKEKQKAEDAEGQVDDEQSTTLNGTAESTSTSRKEKRKRKRKAEETQVEAPEEEEEPVASTQQDEDMPDAPAADQEEPTVVDETALQDGTVQDTNTDQLQSDTPTSFHSIRMSLYLPIPAIAASGQLSAVLALHLSPLLLTFFPPVSGVILSYHDPVLSARPEAGLSKPLLPPSGELPAEEQEETLARIGEEFGASWAWLTATFLVFRPQPGDELTGWTNAMSEGFIGLVSYNYFQSSVAKSRIPKAWSWSGPSRQQTKQRKTPRKGKLNDSDGPSQESYIDSQETVVAREDDAIDGVAGCFVDEDGNAVPEDLTFKVVDLEMIPAQERGQRFALQLEGTLLGEEEEHAVREEERLKWENRQGKRVSRSRASTPGTPMMSGGLAAMGRVGSVVSTP
ncbi:hypothetical protein PMZ80_002892 [Knufia obscura]|uniref:DNA-directed RNA polymerase subunit n=1 Tax=Knufia obscura TaxID=1635080 RepID=A0ABR0RYM6_9EURO|nr:hypothetical protein PMZ80_002892 [Knufia obscura]